MLTKSSDIYAKQKHPGCKKVQGDDKSQVMLLKLKKQVL